MSKFQLTRHPHEGNQIATNTDINGGNLSPSGGNMVGLVVVQQLQGMRRAQAGSASGANQQFWFVWTHNVKEAWEEGGREGAY